MKLNIITLLAGIILFTFSLYLFEAAVVPYLLSVTSLFVGSLMITLPLSYW
jgi:hypothetical protein